jgi:hypothetical protein
MFIESVGKKDLFAPEERDVFVSGWKTLRSYGAKNSLPATLAINIWPRYGPYRMTEAVMALAAKMTKQAKFIPAELHGPAHRSAVHLQIQVEIAGINAGEE